MAQECKNELVTLAQALLIPYVHKKKEKPRKYSVAEEDKLLSVQKNVCPRENCVCLSIEGAKKLSPMVETKVCILCSIVDWNQILSFVRQYTIEVPEDISFQGCSFERDSLMDRIEVNAGEGFHAPIRWFDKRHYVWNKDRFTVKSCK